MGFNFTKINAEKSEKQIQNLSIKTNIDISNITPVKADILSSREEILAVKFEYSIDYEPEFAKISFTGIVLLSLDPEEAKNVLEMWKEKKMPEEFKTVIFNIILKKSGLRSLQLEEELNLPTHIPLPSIKLAQASEDSNKDDSKTQKKN